MVAQVSGEKVQDVLFGVFASALQVQILSDIVKEPAVSQTSHVNAFVDG